jgi:putative component of membrane protein insertase Oxa1/YidC/SpoIIIJ protein YidD
MEFEARGGHCRSSQTCKKLGKGWFSGMEAPVLTALSKRTHFKRSMLKTIIISLVNLYQISFPLFRSGLGLQTNCLHYPSCSNYMKQAMEEQGGLRGLWLGLKQLIQCHPFKRSLLWKKI